MLSDWSVGALGDVSDVVEVASRVGPVHRVSTPVRIAVSR